MTNIILRGYADLEGETLGVFLAGLDCGNWPVIGGRITIPLDDGIVADGFLTDRYLTQVSTLGRDWGLKTAILDGGRWNVPCVVGYRYESRGQTMRPVEPAAAGSANGPAIGKMKRNHMVVFLLNSAANVEFGQDFDLMGHATFTTEGGTPLTRGELFSGGFVDSVKGPSNRDGRICWRVTGPYSCQVSALGGFIKTNDQ